MCKLQFFFSKRPERPYPPKLMSTKLISTKLTLRLSPSQCAYWYKLDISDIKNYLWLLWLILQIPKECLSLFFPLWAEINGTTKRHEHTATCAAARPGGRRERGREVERHVGLVASTCACGNEGVYFEVLYVSASVSISTPWVIVPLW